MEKMENSTAAMEIMDVERNLPPSLKQQMSDKKEQTIFVSWLKRSNAMPKPPIAASPPLHSPTYVAGKNQFVLSLDLSSRPLKEAILRYQGQNKSCGSWPESCSWRDVMEELESLRHLNVEYRERSLVHRAFRHGSVLSQATMQLIDGLPQEFGVGLLQTGFRTIFHAVRRRFDTCDKILEAFEHIPELIIRAENLCGIYPDNEQLSQSLGNLYHQVASCIPRLLEILGRLGPRDSISTIKKHCKTFFGDSLAEVDDLLKPVNHAERRLSDCQRELDSRNLAITANHTRAALELAENNRQQIKEMGMKVEDRLADLRPSLDRIEDELASFQRETVNGIWTAVQELLRLSKIQLEGQRRQRQLEQFMFSLSPTPTQRQVSVAMTVTVPFTVCSEEEQSMLAKDLYQVRRKYHDFSTKALARAQYLLTMDRFASWLMEPGSDLLLVDGHCNDQSIGKVSPMSVLCACLVETLVAAAMDDSNNVSPVSFAHQPRIVLFFFCGQHLWPTSGDRLSGPQGMIRGLVNQLLYRWPYDTLPEISSFLVDRGSTYRAGQDTEVLLHDLELCELCMLFEQILGQLGPEYPVCCIIEGISSFETSLYGWNADVMEVVACFQRIASRQWDASGGRAEVGDDPGCAMVKFLLVSTERSILVRSAVAADDHLELRAGRMSNSSWLLSP